MRIFKTNEYYTCNSICDNDCVFEFLIKSRTKRFVTIYGRMYGVKRVKINLDEKGNEYIFPLGKYSMASILRA